MTPVLSSILTDTEKVANLLAEFKERKKQCDFKSCKIGLEAYQLAKKTGEKKLIAIAGYELTHFYVDLTTELDKAIEYLQEIITFYDPETDVDEYACFLLRLGLSYDYKGDIAEAKRYYDETIRYLEPKTNLSRESTISLGRALFNLSIIYGDLELENLHNDCLSRAMELFKQCDHRGGISRGFISFGVADWRNKEYESAIKHYENAAAIAEEMNDIQPYCIALGNIGVVKSTIGKNEEAITSIELALKRIKEQTNKHFTLSIHKLAGTVFQHVGDYKKSDFYFAEAARMYAEIGKKSDNYDFFQSWAKSLQMMGKHEEAYRKLERAYEIREATMKKNKQVVVSDATLRMQVNESKREQELWKQKNEEIKAYARKLEISNAELNQFAYIASHDLKEPLRMITNYAQLLTKSLGKNLTSDQIHYLQYLNDGAKRMMQIINDLLDLSKIGAALHITPISLDVVVSDVKAMLRNDLRQQQVDLQIGKLPTVVADRTIMQQLFLNLISNALKYNRSDTKIVAISHTETTEEYRIEVADNGIGIDPANRKKVFEIFQRLHNRNEYDGTGIGLAICKKIVESLGGSIWVEDTALGGSNFCFTIPK